jgi:predicted RNA binding protein YcfA (HicA-like mRNA interferase family)
VIIEKNSKKIIARLKREGFSKVSQNGSHVKLRKGNRTVIIPHPKKDLPLGTARNIAKQVGWI